MSTSSKPRPRPRFELTVGLPVAEVLERFRGALGRSEQVRGLALDYGRVELTCSENEVRFWSPQLTIDVVEEGEGARLRARFGPHPHVWTLYVALYSTSLAFAVGCVIFGISQWMVDDQPRALILIPVSFVLSGLVYGASYVGQGLGSLQMQELRNFVETALRD